MIINLWRPLHGPVTNSPLGMVDYRSVAEADTLLNGNMFGVGLRFHHNPAQKWYYLRHQMPDEIVILKCFDSLQGEDGSAIYAGHTALQMDDSSGVDEDKVRDRESIEIRLIAVWE